MPSQDGLNVDAIPDCMRATLADWPKSALHPSTHLVSYGLASFNAICTEVTAHGAIIAGNQKSSKLVAPLWVNTFMFNANSNIPEIYHHFDFDTHRGHNLAEAQHRVNRRLDVDSLGGGVSQTPAFKFVRGQRWLRIADTVVS